MENKYHVKHIKQNLDDFQNDIHRFSFWYNGQHCASCIGAVTVLFHDDNIPEDVGFEVEKKIYQLIDTNESKWALPYGAQEIIDAYCAEEFG